MTQGKFMIAKQESYITNNNKWVRAENGMEITNI